MPGEIENHIRSTHTIANVKKVFLDLASTYPVTEALTSIPTKI